MKSDKKKEIRIVEFIDAVAMQQWLEQNHTLNEGIWLKIAKKSSGIQSVNYQEALKVALCYGWIDGQVNKLDENYYIQKFTPRRARSIWSKRNVGIAEQLIAEGRMQPPGLKEIERAKADGRWQKAYDSPGNMEIPDDFLLELNKNQKASMFFRTLNKTNLFAIGYRLQTAKTTETRQKRMTEIIRMLEKEEKFHWVNLWLLS